MIYLTDTLPNFCPSCGREHSPTWKKSNAEDFYAGASGKCPCGATYQYVETKPLIDASKANTAGDLHRYAA